MYSVYVHSKNCSQWDKSPIAFENWVYLAKQSEHFLNYKSLKKDTSLNTNCKFSCFTLKLKHFTTWSWMTFCSWEMPLLNSNTSLFIPISNNFYFLYYTRTRIQCRKCPILMLQNNFICMTTVGCKNTQIVQKHVQEWTVHIITSSLMLSHLWWENMNQFLGAKLQYHCRCARVFTFFETEINILVQTKIHWSRNQIQQNVLS